MNSATPGKNYQLWAAVVALALVFWFLVKMNKAYDHTREIPLHIVNNNESVCLKYPAPRNVRVEFEGRGIDLLRLSFYDPVYEVDLSAASERFHLNLTEHREYVRVEDELEVGIKSIVTPHQLDLELDVRIERQLPVVINANVQTLPGFILVNALAEPESLTIVGPATYVDTLSRLVATSPPYSDVKLAFRDELPLKKSDLYYSEYEQEVVSVFYNVQRLAEKEVRDIPVSVRNIPVGQEVVPLPSVVTLYIKGGEKVLAEADAADFEVYIDYALARSRPAARVKAVIQTDLNLTHMETRPPQFELIVQRRKGRS